MYGNIYIYIYIHIYIYIPADPLASWRVRVHSSCFLYLITDKQIDYLTKSINQINKLRPEVIPRWNAAWATMSTWESPRGALEGPGGALRGPGGGSRGYRFQESLPFLYKFTKCSHLFLHRFVDSVFVCFWTMFEPLWIHLRIFYNNFTTVVRASSLHLFLMICRSIF